VVVVVVVVDNGGNKNCKYNNNICNVFRVDLCTFLFDNSM